MNKPLRVGSDLVARDQIAAGVERRAVVGLKLELRAEGDAPKKLVGYAALFNTPADIGGWFMEQLSPGAFTDAIKNDDVRALIDHDPSKIIGRNKAGTLKLEEDQKGLRVEIDPPDTQLARDLLISVERGDVSQMSFGFRTLKETWDESVDPPMRTLEKVELFDVSVVTFPAYEQTEIGLRSAAEPGLRALEDLRSAHDRAGANARRRLRMKSRIDLPR